MSLFDESEPPGSGLGHLDRRVEMCAYCPKLCNFVCPVSTATCRESHTPWGKQTCLWEIQRGMIPAEPVYAESLYACTNCLACTHVCDHDVDVSGHLQKGREMAFARGILPTALADAHRGLASRSAEAARRLGDLDPGPAPGPGHRVVVMPGCTAALADPAPILDAVTVLREIVGGELAVSRQGCCGLPWLHAGDVEGFRREARALAASLAHARRVIVLDPGCARTMREFWPEHGIEAGIEVLTLVEAVLPHLHRFVRRSHPETPVFWHDPCQLGRGLGIYDAPREILLRLIAGGARELSESRELEPCCGGGGAIPVTMPDASERMASRLVGLLRAEGARTVVTHCPTCRRQLSGHEGIRVLDIAELLARAV